MIFKLSSIILKLLQATDKRFTLLQLYGELTKYRLSLAVAFSSVTGYILASREIDNEILLIASGVFFLSCGSSALNQFTERETDAIMERTKNRPIPTGKIKNEHSVILFSILLGLGTVILGITGINPCLLGIANIILYNFLYTPLKRITSLAVIPGALVGAVPPLIGFVAAGGQPGNITIISFSLFMFLWQLPHFWLLLIRYRKDFMAAGIKTPFNNLNESQIKLIIFIWTLMTSSFIIIAGFRGLFGNNLFYEIIIINLVFIIVFYKLLFSMEKSSDWKWAFLTINSFPLLLMLILISGSLYPE